MKSQLILLLFENDTSVAQNIKDALFLTSRFQFTRSFGGKKIEKSGAVFKLCYLFSLKSLCIKSVLGI